MQEEEVHEMAHLEVLPPSVRIGYGYMSAQDEDGLIDITDMNSKDSLVLYKDKAYSCLSFHSTDLGSFEQFLESKAED